MKLELNQMRFERRTIWGNLNSLALVAFDKAQNAPCVCEVAQLLQWIALAQMLLVSFLLVIGCCWGLNLLRDEDLLFTYLLKRGRILTRFVNEKLG